MLQYDPLLRPTAAELFKKLAALPENINTTQL